MSNTIPTSLNLSVVGYPSLNTWNDVANSVREKRVETLNSTIRIVEFSPGFVERDWCQKAHVGYVISGKLKIQFRNSELRYQEGDGISIDAGAEREHRAIVTEVVTLFLVEPKPNQGCKPAQA